MYPFASLGVDGEIIRVCVGEMLDLILGEVESGN